MSRVPLNISLLDWFFLGISLSTRISMQRDNIPLGLLWEETCESTLAAIGQLVTTDQVTHPEGFVPKERDKYWETPMGSEIAGAGKHPQYPRRRFVNVWLSHSLSPASHTMPKARAAAEKALALDGNLAEAHTSLAVIAQDYDWAWKRAEKEYRRAIELDPNYATAHHWYAEYLSLQGRFGEAFSEIERARRLDPLSLIIAADEAAIFYYSRQYDRAIAQFRSVLEMEPNFSRANMLLYAYTEKGMFGDAVSLAEKYCRPEDTLGNVSFLAYVYGRAGQKEQAHDELSKLEEFYRNNEADPVPIFVAYMAIGDKDKAFGALDRAFAARSSNLTNLKVNPIYDSLRSDPRFEAILRRMGLSR